MFPKGENEVKWGGRENSGGGIHTYTIPYELGHQEVLQSTGNAPPTVSNKPHRKSVTKVEMYMYMNK